MIKNLSLLTILSFSLNVVAENEIVVVPFRDYKIVSDIICCYVVANFEMPSCYKFQRLSRMDLVKEAFEGMTYKADVFIAGIFSHSSDCSCEEDALTLISETDPNPLPWEFTIKKQIYYLGPESAASCPRSEVERNS